jgi:hypothetical protein
VSPNEIRNESIQSVMDPAAPSRPDLFVCNDSAEIGNDLNCGDVTGTEVLGNLAAVIISLGKNFDQGAGASNIQRENFDNFNDGTQDKVYISATRSTVEGAEFDDIVKWISPNLLISKMIEAGQLP